MALLNSLNEYIRGGAFYFKRVSQPIIKSRHFQLSYLLFCKVYGGMPIIENFITPSYRQPPDVH